MLRAQTRMATRAHQEGAKLEGTRAKNISGCVRMQYKHVGTLPSGSSLPNPHFFLCLFDLIPYALPQPNSTRVPQPFHPLTIPDPILYPGTPSGPVKPMEEAYGMRSTTSTMKNPREYVRGEKRQ